MAAGRPTLLSPSSADSLTHASTEELLLEVEERLLELRRRIIRHRDSCYDAWGDGLDAQGYWPEER